MRSPFGVTLRGVSGLLLLLGTGAFGATISGVASDARGKIQGQVIVVFTRTTPAGSGPQTGVAVADEAGAFSFRDLVPGSYALCVQGERHDYVDKCAWSTPYLAQVSGANDTVTANIALEPGVRVQIVVQDPKRLLAMPGRTGATGQIAVGIWMKNGMFRAVPRVTQADQSAAWEAVLPPNDSFQMQMELRGLELKDKAGGELLGLIRGRPVNAPIVTKTGVPNIVLEYLADVVSLPVPLPLPLPLP